jgi:hypothetical protein
MTVTITYNIWALLSILNMNLFIILFLFPQLITYIWTCRLDMAYKHMVWRNIFYNIWHDPCYNDNLLFICMTVTWPWQCFITSTYVMTVDITMYNYMTMTWCQWHDMTIFLLYDINLDMTRHDMSMTMIWTSLSFSFSL